MPTAWAPDFLELQPPTITQGTANQFNLCNSFVNLEEEKQRIFLASVSNTRNGRIRRVKISRKDQSMWKLEYTRENEHY